MNTLTTALHECAVNAVEAYDLDILNWVDDNATSFDLKVLEAAQQTVADCSADERKKLRMSNRCGSLVQADVVDSLYKLNAMAVDPGLVAALVIEMHRVVNL